MITYERQIKHIKRTTKNGQLPKTVKITEIH